METPVGTPCAECKNPLGNQSRGFEIPLYRKDLPPTNQYYHRFCFLKQIIPGALEPDPDVPDVDPVDEMRPPD